MAQNVFDSPAKLQCHLIEHTFEGSTSYVCNVCNGVFTAPHLIQQHLIEHGLDSRRFDCKMCHQRFFFQAELDNHLAFFHSNSAQHPNNARGDIFPPMEPSPKRPRLHDLSRVKCFLCPEMFDTSADRQQHYFKEHGDSDIQDSKETFPCTQCDQVFSSPSNLQGHLRMHELGTNFACKECDKKFTSAKNLSRHIRSHNGIGSYVSKKNLPRKESTKSHTEDKLFSCPHCEKSFARKCHAKEHLKLHVTSTTHPCEVCGETFQSPADLKSHLAGTHNKNFEHRCSECNEVFESSEARDQHLLKDHDVRTSPVEDDLSESSLGHSSSSGDTKDLYSSDGDSNLEGDSDTRDSPLSIVEEPPEVQDKTPQTVA